MTARLQYRRPGDTGWHTVITAGDADRKSLEGFAPTYNRLMGLPEGTQWQVISDEVPWWEREASAPIAFLTVIAFLALIGVAVMLLALAQ